MARPQRSSVQVELLGWAATAIFVSFSYALRRFLDRRPVPTGHIERHAS